MSNSAFPSTRTLPPLAYPAGCAPDPVPVDLNITQAEIDAVTAPQAADALEQAIHELRLTAQLSRSRRDRQHLIALMALHQHCGGTGGQATASVANPVLCAAE